MENPYIRGHPSERFLSLDFYNIRIFNERLPLIINGQITLDVRITSPTFERIRVGTILRYNGVINRKVTRVGAYPNFDEMMQNEDPTKINPTLPPEIQIASLRRFYSPRQEREGIRVFELGNVI